MSQRLKSLSFNANGVYIQQTRHGRHATVENIHLADTSRSHQPAARAQRCQGGADGV